MSDKNRTVNDLYQAAVISLFAVGYSVLGKKILKIAPPSIQKLDLEDMGKLVAIITASEMIREYLMKQKILAEPINVLGYTSATFKMASIVMLIGGALANALAFTSSSFLFLKLSKDSSDKEKKRHDLAIEQLQKEQVEWAQK